MSSDLYQNSPQTHSSKPHRQRGRAYGRNVEDKKVPEFYGDPNLIPFLDSLAELLAHDFINTHGEIKQ